MYVCPKSAQGKCGVESEYKIDCRVHHVELIQRPLESVLRCALQFPPTDLLVMIPRLGLMIGRDTDQIRARLDLQEHFEYLSPAHAELTWIEGAQIQITDRSRNGTYLDGVRLAPDVPTLVRPGQSLRLANVTIELIQLNRYNEPIPPDRG